MLTGLIYVAEKLTFIQGYTKLSSLELGAISQLSWPSLYKLAAAIRSPHLYALVLRYDAVTDADALIALDSAETSPVDDILNVQLPSLRKFCFVVEYDPAVVAGRDAQWKDNVKERVRGLFYRSAEDGKLQVEFEARREVSALQTRQYRPD